MLTAVPHKPQKTPAKEFTPDNTTDTDQLSQEASVYSSPEPANSFSYPQNQLPTTPSPAYRQVKKRRRLTDEETTILNAVFEENSKPTQNVRVDLAKQLNMSSRAIQVWFQNRRAKVKRDTGPKTESKSNKAKRLTLDKNQEPDKTIPAKILPLTDDDKNETTTTATAATTATTDKPIDNIIEEKPIERPGKKRIERPGEKQIERPGEKQIARPGEKPIERPGEKQIKNQELNPSVSPKDLTTNRPNEMPSLTSSCPPTSDEDTDALVSPATPQNIMVDHGDFRGFVSSDTADTSLLVSKPISEEHKNTSQSESVNKVCRLPSTNKRKATCEKLLKWSEPSYVKHENCDPSQSLKYPQNLIYFSGYPQTQPLPENHAVEPPYMPPLSLSYPLLPDMPSSMSTSIAPVPLPINTASISQSLSSSIPCTYPNTHTYAVAPLSTCLPCHSFIPSPYPPSQVSPPQTIWIADDSSAADIDYGMARIPPGYNNNINVLYDMMSVSEQQWQQQTVEGMYHQPYQHGVDVIDGYTAYDRHDVYNRYNQCAEYNVNEVNLLPRPVCAITPFAGAVWGIDERHAYEVEYGRINDEIIANERGVQHEYREYNQGY